MSNNKFITVTGCNTKRKIRINILNITIYVENSDKTYTIIKHVSGANTEVLETPEEIDCLINLYSE